MHRVWFGGAMPSHLRAFGTTWSEHHPGWEHCLWTEANLPPLRNQDLFDHAEQMAPGDSARMRSDLVRYELLARYGGVYVDCDFECLRPLDDLLDGVECFAARETPRWVANGIIGARPGHPFITTLIAALPANARDRIGEPVSSLSGPDYLSAMHPCFAGSVTVFPPKLFYPYTYLDLERAGDHFPEAYAVHHWEGLRRRG